MADGEEKETKQVTQDPVLAAACHAAAHAIAGILLGVPFAGAEIGSGDAAGRLIVEGKPGPPAEEGMVSAMAGAAFDALLRPTAPLLSIFARSCRCGFCKSTWQPTSICFGDTGWKDRKKVMPAFLRSKGLVRENWGTIVRVGRMLAVRGRMAYDEILETATDPEAACPPGRRSHAGTATSAGKSKNLNPLEDVARRHWDTCLHEAAHAVMDTRDGHGVSMAEIATWPSVFERGRVTCLGGKPLLSSLVAGNLAQRLWGVGKYCRLGRRGNGAAGDFGAVALLEARKRGSETISKEDRKAAMQAWQEEDRKLESRILLDPTLELQIKAVAKALSLRGMLDGGEVRRVMEEALEACSSPDVPAAAPAAGHGG
ncbi:MAG: hypothetical protein LAO04_05805 [Acidobacteriia bacterium]|nr:hypothetical protein [Terriglobia bacterium]